MTSGGDNRARLLALYGTMCRIRAFEETALAAHRAGEIPGPLHVSIGQEAVAAAVCLNLRTDDRITSNHRGHGHALAKGAGVGGMMEELLGRAGGHCRGKGGSMHIADFSVGMLGANGVVAGGIPIAVGAAQGLRLLGSSAIVCCFFGDGAINRGPFLEGLNWAALYRLPVLFVCEDNGVAAFTAAASVTAGPGRRGTVRGAGRARADGRRQRRAGGGRGGGPAGGGGARRRRSAPAARHHLPPVRPHQHRPRRLARPGAGAGRARGRAARAPARRACWRRALRLQHSTRSERRRRPRWRRARRAAVAAPWPTPAVAWDDVQDSGAVQEAL
jgi:pyruvate dehydrogenase E1 component alpha subunit